MRVLESHRVHVTWRAQCVILIGFALQLFHLVEPYPYPPRKENAVHVERLGQCIVDRIMSFAVEDFTNVIIGIRCILLPPYVRCTGSNFFPPWIRTAPSGRPSPLALHQCH
jgi:hypothetical protein